MTYYCGTAGLTRLGIANDGPRIVCDECGIVYRLRTDRPPPAWFMDGKAPPGWKRMEKPKRHDRCANCRKKVKP